MLKIEESRSFINHWAEDLTNEQYHSNRDFVSSSQLKHLITESPAYFKEYFERRNQKTTAAMGLSTLVHHAVLEGEDFIKRYVVMPKFEGHANSTIHKAAKAEWITAHRHKIIVTEEELETLEGTYESIFNHADASMLLRGSAFERSGFYVDDTTGIPCRIRYDSYDKSSRVISDIKAVRSCKRDQFQFAIRDYRWDMSLAMYGEGIRAIDGAGPDDFVFIAVEKTRPYTVAVYTMAPRTIKIARYDYQNALLKLQSCLTTNSWPTYQSEMEEIDLPEQFIKRHALDV